MVTKGQELWSKLLTDIKDTPGWPYPSPFWSTIELFREATRCYDAQSYVSAITACRTLIDKTIFVATTSLALPEDRELVCSLCNKKFTGFQNFERHLTIGEDNGGHKEAKQFWSEVDKLRTERKISSNPTDYDDSWEGKEGLKVQAIKLGMLTSGEADKVEEVIRIPGHIVVHAQRFAREYENWLKENEEKLKAISQGKEVDVDWFSPVPSDKQTYEVLNETEKHLSLMVRNYVKSIDSKSILINVIGVV